MKSVIRESLKDIISAAFSNEAEFLNRFFGHSECELLECYMASERTKIAVLMPCGETVTTTIPTDEFMDWVDEMDAEAADCP